MKKTNRLVLAALAVAFLTAAFAPTAAEAGEEIQMVVKPDVVYWDVSASFKAAELEVSGPECATYIRRFEPGETPFFKPFDEAGNPLPDGVYSFDLWVGPNLDSRWNQEEWPAPGMEGASQLCRGRDELPPLETLTHTGYAAMVEARYADPRLVENRGAVEQAATAPLMLGGAPGSDATSGELTPMSAAQVISGDLTVYNSICVGFDCLANETYGFDTFRLKENNLRIHFDDTSTAASFPRTDWRIIANESANGGASKFSIEDSSAGRTPFTIEANAPSHSLYVDDGGRTGFGTSTPSVDLHVKDGDTPTLRLEQDGTSGFAPQVWDVAGNETSFFVRDATNGSTLPFRIRPGASSNALVIDNDDNIGVGILNPTETVHMQRNGDVAFALDNSGGVRWLFKNNSANDAFTVTASAGGGNAPFKVFPNTAQDTLVVGTAGGAQRVEVGGELRVNGMVMNVPDYVFDEDYSLLPLAEQGRYMLENKHLPAVGRGNDDFVDLVSHQYGMLEELEKAHLYIQQLHETIRGLEEQSEAKDAALNEVLDRLDRLEAATALR